MLSQRQFERYQMSRYLAEARLLHLWDEAKRNIGAYPTPIDPYHRFCHRCREALHRNHTGWQTSNPQADIHGGIG